MGDLLSKTEEDDGWMTWLVRGEADEEMGESGRRVWSKCGRKRGGSEGRGELVKRWSVFWWVGGMRGSSTGVLGVGRCKILACERITVSCIMRR